MPKKQDQLNAARKKWGLPRKGGALYLTPEKKRKEVAWPRKKKKERPVGKEGGNAILLQEGKETSGGKNCSREKTLQ